jgi:hypothetical protein
MVLSDSSHEQSLQHVGRSIVRIPWALKKLLSLVKA